MLPGPLATPRWPPEAKNSPLARFRYPTDIGSVISRARSWARWRWVGGV